MYGFCRNESGFVNNRVLVTDNIKDTSLPRNLSIRHILRFNIVYSTAPNVTKPLSFLTDKKPKQERLCNPVEYCRVWPELSCFVG
jgi:hypothetical protein